MQVMKQQLHGFIQGAGGLRSCYVLGEHVCNSTYVQHLTR